MPIWVIGDLHLSFGCPGKEMDVFGPKWNKHHEKIRENWDKLITPDDLVLIPGDISWAMHMEQALADLEWIDKRPGTKVMIKGNHDFWWHSASKVRKALPKSIHIISNDAFVWNEVAIGGTRLWDSSEYNFMSCIDIQQGKAKAMEEFIPDEKVKEENEKIFQRELLRLEMSLKGLNKNAKLKIAMTHYPPIGLDLKDSKASKIFENAGVKHVVFGHLHSIKDGLKLFGEKNGIEYHLTSCDFLNFLPIQIA
jgi:uncharacterized protein